MGGWAQPLESLSMSRSAIAHVCFPAVGGKAQRQFGHDLVPCFFCKNGRSCNGEGLAVPLHQSTGRTWEIRSAIAVHKGMVRCLPQLRDSLSHRLVGRLQNVEVVDFCHANKADGRMDARRRR